MKPMSLSHRVIQAGMSLVCCILLGKATCLAEPFGGQVANALIGGGGRYIIVSYTGPFVVIWDLDRLWDYLQPIQVHAFRGSDSLTTNAMRIAVSQGGKWLAYAGDEAGDMAKKVYVCQMGPGFSRRHTLDAGEYVRSLELSLTGQQLLILTDKQLLVADVASEKIISSVVFTAGRAPRARAARTSI